MQVLTTDGLVLYIGPGDHPPIKSGSEAPLFLLKGAAEPVVEPAIADSFASPPVGSAIYVSFSGAPPPKPSLRDVQRYPPVLFKGQKLLVEVPDEKQTRASFSDPVAELLTDGDRPWFERGMGLFGPKGKA